MAADGGFERARDPLGVEPHVGARVAAAGEREGRLQPHQVAAVRGAHREARQYGRAGAQAQAGRAAGQPRRRAEEADLHAAAEHVAVREQRHQLVASERNNIRAALAFAVEAGNGELGLRIVAALENFWVTVADPAEGRRWVEALLPLGAEPPALLHACAIRCLGNCAAIAGDDEAEELYQQTFDEFRELGDTKRAAVTLHRIAVQAAVKGDTARARKLIDESIAMHRAVGFRRGEAAALSLVADMTRKTAPEEALALYDQTLAIARETGFTWFEKGNHLGKALAFLARAAADGGDVDRAGRLWGAIEAEDARAPIPGWRFERDRTGPFVFAHAGPELDAALAAGRELSLDDAVDLALR